MKTYKPHPAAKLFPMLEIHPSTTPGYSWLAFMQHGCCVEGLAKPVDTSQLEEVIKVLGWSDARRVIGNKPQATNPMLAGVRP